MAKEDASSSSSSTTTTTPACHGILESLVRCVRTSECVKVHGRSVSDCLGGGQAEAECSALRIRWLECRRRAADARSRIQGNKLDK